MDQYYAETRRYDPGQQPFCEFFFIKNRRAAHIRFLSVFYPFTRILCKKFSPVYNKFTTCSTHVLNPRGVLFFTVFCVTIFQSSRGQNLKVKNIRKELRSNEPLTIRQGDGLHAPVHQQDEDPHAEPHAEAFEKTQRCIKKR